MAVVRRLGGREAMAYMDDEALRRLVLQGEGVIRRLLVLVAYEHEAIGRARMLRSLGVSEAEYAVLVLRLVELGQREAGWAPGAREV